MDIINMLLGCDRIIRAEKIDTPEDFADRVSIYAIRYRSDEFEIEGLVGLPKEFDESSADKNKKLQIVIYNRGGNRDFGYLRPLMICGFAAAGYACFASQYRGGIGCTGMEEYGGSDINDVLNLIDISMDMPFTTGDKVYMIGHSRGGLMTYITCSRSDKVRAAAVWAGVSDLRIMYYSREDSMKQVCHELVGGTPEELPEEYEKRSGVCFADKIKCPILICQGTNDWRVIPEQSYSMDQKLEAAGKEHKLIIYEGADHSLKGTTARKETIEWFKAHPI